MQTYNKTLRRSILAALGMTMTMGLAACGSDDDSGSLSVQLTDGPVDNATAVYVEVTGVSVQGPSGQRDFELDSPMTINLLDLSGNAAETLLEDVEVEAGNYQWMRLGVNAQMSMMDSYVELEDGSQHSLFIPSGAQTGLKLNRSFVVPAGGSADFTIDFDVRKSLHQPGQSAIDYILRPTLRLVNNVEVGTVAGTVTSGLVPEGCDPAVYLFEGSDVTPDDVDGNEPDPITSAIPEMNNDTGNFDYEIGFVEEGDYTITYTCDAGMDEPDTDDSLAFDQTQNISVTVDETTTVDFQ
ncbi:MAG: DUF4382 domain-containing protein [Gammaproteobacteria bacterium]|nr:DUF4382 domain-containing protein [Gammaproteobacteria bacterium]